MKPMNCDFCGKYKHCEYYPTLGVWLCKDCADVQDAAALVGSMKSDNTSKTARSSSLPLASLYLPLKMRDSLLKHPLIVRITPVRGLALLHSFSGDDHFLFGEGKVSPERPQWEFVEWWVSVIPFHSAVR